MTCPHAGPLPEPPAAPSATVPAEEGGETLGVRWRSVYGAPPPRRIRLELPGWAGESNAYGDGAPAQPWHCQPFVEGATYGLELVYPYRTECRVSVDGAGALVFEGGHDAELEAMGLGRPFGAFARRHYGMATALDLLPPPGYALRLGPHPRFFTATTGDVPLALPGHLQRFWPVQFFAVFQAPPPGAVHVFRPGEPYAQLLLVPVAQTYDVAPMPPDERDDRARQDRQVTMLTYFLSKHVWRSDAGYWFNDKYKQLLRLFRRGGEDAVRAHLQKIDDFANPPAKDAPPPAPPAAP